MAKVSVIMPVYNGVRFVGKAVESVLAQNFGDWELIVIDDGSTDQTADVLAGFRDERIRIIQQPNGGEAIARNRGLNEARGEYLAFLDADDLYLPTALSDMSGYLDIHREVDALYSDGYFCDEEDRTLGRLAEIRPGPYTGQILEPLVLNPAVITVPVCTMTRLAVIRNSGVRFDPALVIGPDWDFWIHLARHARFGNLERVTCMYRVHQTNITKTAGTKRRNADLVRGRMKVMNETWFQELSLYTRRRFFEILLIDLLDNQPEQQNAITTQATFLALPADVQAHLLRLTASNYLRQQQHLRFAQDCLARSLELEPHSPKARTLLQLSRRSPALTAATLAAWLRSRRAASSMLGLGRRRVKSVPAGLAPAPESR